jgi:hypothetical protein
MDSYCHHLVNIPRNETRHTTLHFLDQLERAILTQVCWCHVYNVLSFASCWREKEKLIKISYLSRNSKQSTFRLLILQYLFNSFTETRRYYIRQGAEYNWETWSTLPPTPQSSEWYRSYTLSLFFHACHMPRPSHPLLDLPNDIWRWEQIIKFLIVQIPSFFGYFTW